MSIPHTVQVFAPAKINLSLHVTGQRNDGYHLLDSFVAFAHLGDTLTVTAPGRQEISVSGRFAQDVPTNRSNLILKAAEQAWPDMPLSFHLHKDLPVASGIGGGSADAAASYRAIALLRQLCGSGKNDLLMTDVKIAALASLGADIPMCVYSEAAFVRGIGDDISPMHALPALPVVLVNPGIAVSTSSVFAGLTKKNNPPMAPLPDAPDAAALIGWLAGQRNDLQPPAIAEAPVIQQVLDRLSEMDGCQLARMSGSGATCFALFGEPEMAREAARLLKEKHPAWWVQASVVNGPSAAAPQRMRSTT